MDRVEPRAEPSPNEAAIVAVLAGGAGMRVGGAKAMVRLAGQPLLSYPVRAAFAAGLEPLVVAKAGTELPEIEAPVVREEPSDYHPLHGVIAALRAARGRPVVIVACDMPLVSAELLAWLAGLTSTAIPIAGGVLRPLLARYDTTAEPSLSAATRDGMPARTAALALRPRLIGEAELAAFGRPEHLLLNVNDKHVIHS